MKNTNLVNLINNEIAGIMKEFKKYDIEKVFSLNNLKLYDISGNEYFDEFCQDNYAMFEEYINELGVETLSLGRTSSFWLKNIDCNIDYYNYCDTLSNNNIDYKIELLLNEFLEYNIGYDYIASIDNNNIVFENMDINEFNNNELIELLEDIKTSKKYLNDFITDNIKNVILVIDYIENFKNNQVSIYNDFIENN